jgi:4-amino-4-deoxy-L-arabinose transferase-like glycosyltransferase
MILKKVNSRYVFILLLILISWYYQYPQILLKKPQSVHNWRQSDCASITLNYYQNGMKFFQPEVHGLVSKNFTSGQAATSEIPLFYYSIAILYKIFGYHDFIYRIVNTLIFLLGIYALFRLLKKLQVDVIWSFSLSLLFFASPVLAYYGNNYITDITAFSFSLMGWNFFAGYYKSGRRRDFYWAMFFFFLGMSMKISAGISVITIMGIYFLDVFNLIQFKPGTKLFPKRILPVLVFTLILLLVGGWAIYARNYNVHNSCGHFSTTIFPIWNMSAAEMAKTLENVRILWLDQYFHRYTLLFFFALFVINLVHLRKADKLLITANIIIFTGTLLYGILWFATFKEHDYYTINLYILPVITVVTFAEYMNRLYPKFSGNLFIRVALAGLLLFNIYHTNRQMNTRYNGWWNEHPLFRDFDTITPYLRSIGITRFDKVISLPDQSLHTLYIMNQPGWTECYNLNKDSASVQKSIERGARYLVVASAEELNKRPYLSSFTKDLVGKYGTVQIYKLQ